jgi:hypothetical protein
MRLWFSYTMGIDQHLRKPNGQSRESSNMGNTKHMTKHTPQYRKLRILAAQTQPKKKTMLWRIKTSKYYIKNQQL